MCIQNCGCGKQTQRTKARQKDFATAASLLAPVRKALLLY